MLRVTKHDCLLGRYRLEGSPVMNQSKAGSSPAPSRTPVISIFGSAKPTPLPDAGGSNDPNLAGNTDQPPIAWGAVAMAAMGGLTAYVLDEQRKRKQAESRQKDSRLQTISHQIESNTKDKKDVFIPKYSSVESAKIAWKILRDWFFETGDEVQFFGPDNSLTQDVKHDSAFVEFFQLWAEAGYPNTYTWNHRVDERDRGNLFQRLWIGGILYARENIELILSSIGLGSKVSSGRLDPVGGVLGSLDAINLSKLDDGSIGINVINRTGWKSGSRIPGTNYSLFRDRARSEWGPGGTITQHFNWTQPVPKLGKLAKGRK